MATFAGPLFEQMADATTVQQMLNEMPAVEAAVTSVAAAGPGTQQQLSIGFQQGQLEVRKGSDVIEYMLATRSDIISPSSSRRFGNVRLSAGADVRVSRTVRNGTPCWLLQNTHIEACIKQIPQTQRGLAAYFPFEGTGQQVTDSSNNTNTGVLGTTTAVGGDDPARLESCRYGDCLRFDGDDTVTVNGSKDLNITDAITVTAWIHQDRHMDGGSNWTAVRRSQNAYLLEPGDRGEDYWTFGIDNGTGFYRVDTTAPLTIDSWHQLTGVYNGTALKIYVDGKLDNVTSIQGDIERQPGKLWIGGWQDTERFDGRIDEVGIYSYAMQPTEIQARYRTGMYGDSFFQTEDLLVAYRNRDTGLRPDDPVIETFVNGNRTASYGFGSTSVQTTGTGLPSGQVAVTVKTLLGINYEATFSLFSGADFLEIRIDEA